MQQIPKGTSEQLCTHCLSSCAKSQDPCGVWILRLRFATRRMTRGLFRGSQGDSYDGIPANRTCGDLMGREKMVAFRVHANRKGCGWMLSEDGRNPCSVALRHLVPSREC